MTELTNFFDLTVEDLKQHIESWGAPSYRTRQIWHGVYGGLTTNPELLTNLPLDLRDRLAALFTFASIEIISTIVSKDGNTKKFLLRLGDNHRIEAVLMRYRRRITACISTQVGCAMGCVFCATGQMGLKRNLNDGEIIEQVILIAQRLANDKERMTNIVVMGMGEPFHNYDATIQAINRLNDPEGFNLGARRFTISTIGLVPGIARFTREKRQINLAVSLHAATNELREQLIPVNKQYPLERLISVCREYVRKTRRRITFEWALIHEVNDSLKQAHALANLIRDLKCHVNLIPMNPIQNFDGRGTRQRQTEAFRDFLIEHNIPCTIRVRRGIDIQAGCGQLATDENKRSLSPRFDK